MAIQLEIGTPDQRGWCVLVDSEMGDDDRVAMIKPGTVLDGPRVNYLAALINREKDTCPPETV